MIGLWRTHFLTALHSTSSSQGRPHPPLTHCPLASSYPILSHPTTSLSSHAMLGYISGIRKVEAEIWRKESILIPYHPRPVNAAARSCRCWEWRIGRTTWARGIWSVCLSVGRDVEEGGGVGGVCWSFCLWVGETG